MMFAPTDVSGYDEAASPTGSGFPPDRIQGDKHAVYTCPQM